MSDSDYQAACEKPLTETRTLSPIDEYGARATSANPTEASKPQRWIDNSHCFGEQIAAREVMNEKPDVELLCDARNGDSAAIGELFWRHYPFAVRIARSILHSEEDSLDAVQSAYLSAFEHFSSFREQASFKTWITKIVTNKCLVYFRQPERRRTWVRLDDAGPGRSIPHLADPTPSPEEFASKREIAAVVVNAAAGLPKGLQQVVTLCGIAGLSTKDAAGALGITVPAVKVRLFRARSRMRLPLQVVLGPVCRAG